MKATYLAITEEGKVKEHYLEGEDEIDLQEALVDLEADYYKKDGIPVILIKSDEVNSLITEIFKIKGVELGKCDNCNCDSDFCGYKFF